ncbi:two-component system sensor histidine kinase YesM [Paenibacillus anaericanus]|uniref:sensor histidine kinase n=1 Tax=Paenibacillus anaericanus TaxID=170367 RepID=UPI00277DE1C4|nr:histidine kinase [Paenibacillus anaericanus]MDQ0088921.1 two-component system sensor histidine kinase YesM [Paenibacillus anaericanus]
MRIKFSIFQKMLVLLLILLTPVVALYYYSSSESINVIQEELIKASLNRMELFVAQLDASVEKFDLVSAPMLVDTNVLEYLYNHDINDYSLMKTQLLIQEKLSLASASGNWRNDMTVYFPQRDYSISSSPSYEYNLEEFESRFSLGWTYREDLEIGSGFTRTYVTTGYKPARPDDLDVAIRINLYKWSFENLLDTYKSGHSDNPFFYKEGHAIIASRSSEGPKMDGIVSVLGDRVKGRDSGFLIHSFDGRHYLITYYYSNLLEWHLVDSVPLDQIIEPIKQQRVLFGASSIILLLSGIAAASVLYWNVQRPIFHLVRAVQRIKRGDYAYRLPKKSNNEFAFLMQNFNEMATQIQDLIENVLQSRILARDATLKQLQAQIHPHFLYNCLGFIINMTKMGKDRAVMDMAYHLADYYRYTTRMDNQGVSMGEELAFVRIHLEILRLRNETLNYSIELPEELTELRIPRLLIQPIVENANVHGLENVDYPGRVEIKVYVKEGKVHLEVEDNGKGLNKEQINRLHMELRIPAGEYTGCGLWNVYQRLQGNFGPDAELTISQSRLGGLIVSLVWRLQTEDRTKEEEP